MLITKRVILKGQSRKGAYFRVYDKATQKTSYYKIAGKKGVKTKAKALDKFSVSKQKKLTESGKGLLKKKATLHFRIDYTTKNFSRSGHQFQMQDSFITARVPIDQTSEETRQYLRGLFKEAFADQFGGHLAEMIEDEYLVEGLEFSSDAPEGIRIKYNYGGRGWKTADAKLGTVHDLITDKEKFFYGTLKRTRK